jgi:hypothetical protein
MPYRPSSKWMIASVSPPKTSADEVPGIGIGTDRTRKSPHSTKPGGRRGSSSDVGLPLRSFFSPVSKLVEHGRNRDGSIQAVYHLEVPAAGALEQEGQARRRHVEHTINAART